MKFPGDKVTYTIIFCNIEQGNEQLVLHYNKSNEHMYSQ